MKKLLLLLFALPVLQITAQSSIEFSELTSSVVIPNNGTVVATTTVGTSVTADYNFRNTSSTAKSYKMRMYIVVQNAGAEPFYCYGGNCYTYPAPSSPPGALGLNAGESAGDLQCCKYLTTDMQENTALGYTLVKYTIYDINNTADSAQINFQYNAVMGVNELKNNLSSVEISPNPATDNASLLISSNGVKDVKVQMINSLGSTISEKQIILTDGKNKIELHTADLSTGIYFVVIKNGNSNITKKLIVK